jgi:acetyl esterase
VRDFFVEGRDNLVPVRLYQPQYQGVTPVVLYFHGGGFVALDLDTHDDICRRLCQSGCLSVLSIAYRLAPEHPFPAAVRDGISVVEWLGEHAAAIACDGSRIGVAGDSAGGCIAAATAIAARGRYQSRICGQLLFYPVMDHYSASTSSYEEFRLGYGLTAEAMRWFWDQYLSVHSDASNPLASPLRFAEPATLPALTMITAEYDILRDEGEMFARKLSAGGVPVDLYRVPGMTHGFLKWADQIPEVADLIARSAKWMASAIYGTFAEGRRHEGMG